MTNPTLVQKLDEEITKLTQMRDLLADAGVLAVVNHVIGRTQASNLPAPESFRPEANRGSGKVLKAARECVTTLDAPFTKMELAAKMRDIGCVVNAPKTQLHYPVQKLLSEGVLKMVDQGGGRQPTRYQRNESGNRPSDQSEGITNATASSASRFRSELMRAALRCVERQSEPFTTNDLVQSMRTVGYPFVGDAGLSVQSAIAKLLDAGLLEIVNPGDDQQPVLYGRRSN
jgi:hypothetical protein